MWFCLAILMSLSLMRANATNEVRLITLDPGHFHASLVQKTMYPQVDPSVHVYAPFGPDVDEHVNRIRGFNTRPNSPTEWHENVYVGPRYLEKMFYEKAGNVVVLAGNNSRKTEYIERCVKAGFNVLADKPMAINPAGFDLLCQAFAEAATNKVLLYDIMTERYEITSMIQRELVKLPDLFGKLEKGTAENPAVVKSNVHFFFKEVAGKPLIRPGWFYDVRQEGEAVPDVGTHLVDSIQWTCFPDQALDWRKDIKVLNAHRWATKLTLPQFKRSTGLTNFPDYFKADLDADGALNVYANGDVNYTLRGIYCRVTAEWKFEAPPGTGDTHFALLRGTRASLAVRQGPEQKYQATLYIENSKSVSAKKFERSVRDAVAKVAKIHPGLEVKPADTAWEVLIPEKYNIGHEAHFAQVTEKYLGFLAEGKMPAWEVPNMIAKYYTTTEAYRLSHDAKESKR